MNWKAPITGRDAVVFLGGIVIFYCLFALGLWLKHKIRRTKKWGLKE